MEKLLRIRYVYLIAIFFTFLNSILFLFIGVIEAYHGYKNFIKNITGQVETKSGSYLLESLDKFLISLVFMMFSLGVFKLLYTDDNPNSNAPGWLHIHSFKDLKILLWETILVTLVVLTVSENAGNIHHLTWEMLILPVTILILSISLFLMRKE